MRALLCGLALGLALTTLPAVSHADAQPPAANVDRASWDDLGLEEKWDLYRTQTRANVKDGSAPRWRAFLAEAGEFELLEWCAIYEGWVGSGEFLVKANAPQWMRAAVWSLSARDSHSFEAAAVSSLEARAHDVLAYAELHPQVLADPWLKGAVARWKEAGVVPGSAEGMLPPLTPDQVYAHLYAPAVTRSVHQVQRALHGLALSNTRPPEALTQLERLLAHPEERVRLDACLTYAKLPEYLIAVQSLLYRAGDEKESERVREAAVYALGSVSHPAVFAKLLDLATDPDHPGWKAVVARLVDKHDPFVLHGLGALAKASLGTPGGTFLARQMERLGATLARADGDQRRNLLPAQLERAAWLGLAGHPRAAEYLQHLEQRVQDDVAALGPLVLRLRAEYEPTAGLLDRRWWREPADLRPTPEAFAAEVQRILAGLKLPGE